ncbi:MAG: DUF2914 domain-containing protein [Methylococcales bacterium]|nr:DUF2914 domain-containing protein [Methylococcales bacterium]
MTNKKNIKIKVKYPTPGSRPEKDHSVPDMVTVWNVKRILLALGCIVLILFSIFLFIKDDDRKADLQPQTVLPEKVDGQETDRQAQAQKLPEKQANVAEKKVDAPAEPKADAGNHVQRSLLTYKLRKNEPAGEISFPVKVSKKKPIKIYYFVELTGMKGRTVYHEWMLDGELISRKKINISSDNWRTSSRQMFYYTAKPNWTVRTVDENGQVIDEKHFDVIAE